MTEEQFEEMMKEESYEYKPNSAYLGLKIISKYFKEDKCIIGGVEHDIIYAVETYDLIKAGITEDDVKKLGNLGWHINEGYVAYYI